MAEGDTCGGESATRSGCFGGNSNREDGEKLC